MSTTTASSGVGDAGQALLAIAIVGTVSMSMCFAALRGRIRNG